MADPLTSPEHLQATIRIVSLPTRAVLGAAHDERPPERRDLVYVALHEADSPDTVLGWGECSALNAPTYTAEWAEGAYEQLAAGRPIDASSHPMAAAAVEMAHLDADLRGSGQSLADRLGTSGRRSRAGAVVGLGPIPDILDQVEGLVEQGYRRVKCKISPGRVVEPIRAVIERFPGLEVQVDANGSLSVEDIGLLAALRDLGVAAVEQPFAVDDHANAARLVADTDLTVVADEAVASLDDLCAVAQDQAATAVAVKPPRLGGLAPALELVDAARVFGMPCSIGGLLESGLGRHQLAALAPLEPFTITGDLSPARRWLAADPFPDLEMVDGEIPAPTTIGIAGDPDLDILEAHTVRRVVVNAPAPIT